MKILKVIIGTIFVLSSLSCGSSDLTVVNNPKRPDSMLVENSGGAALKGVVSSLFVSNQNDNQASFQFIKSAMAQTVSGLPFVQNTCALEGELDLISSLQGNTGTFGSSDDNVSLVAGSSYCLNESGDENNGFNDFNSQLFSTYTVDTSDTSCFEGDILYSQFLIRSTGSALYLAPSEPGGQKLILRGSFLFADPSDAEFTLASSLDCSLVLDSDGNVISAESSCTNADGSVSLSSSGRECSVDAQ